MVFSWRNLAAAVASVVVLGAGAEAACPNFAYCTAYASGAVVTYNGANYTAIAPIAANRDCSLWTPATDNWWSPGGTCGGGATATATTSGATATRTPTSGGATATRTPAPTATRTPTAASCNYPNWVAGQSYVAGNIVKYTNGGYYKASHDNPGYDPVVSTWYWDPYSCSGGGGGTPTPTSGGGSGLGAIVNSGQFDTMFPPGSRSSTYSYTGFVAGGGAASGFCTTGDDAMKKRECAAFFANSGVETGRGQYIDEIDKQGPSNQSCYCAGGGACGVTCDSSNYTPRACVANYNSWYFGRGWLQISWDFNYCSAGGYLGTSLINNANVLSTDATKTTTASLWYWMTQSGGNNQSPHSCIVNNAGFGCTIKSINGGLECPSMGGGNTGSRDSRINLFNQFLGTLGSSAVGDSSC